MIVKNQINIQDQFLNRVRRDRTRVTVELIGGQKIEGIVMSFDNFSIVLRSEGDQLIYKHAISSISLGGKMEFSESK